MSEKYKQNQILVNYKNTREELLKCGYHEEISYISILKANILAFLTAGPFALLIIFLYLVIWKTLSFEIKSIFQSILLPVVFIGLILVHEFIHGFVWKFFCNNKWESIKIGVIWDKLTPYCYCKEPLSSKQYMIGLLSPFFTLGICMGFVAIILKNPLILFIAVLNILASGGDTTIALKMFKYIENKDVLILDHPTEVGFVSFEK
ncbi:DUF3267 domain-containing protein [Paraclostridium sordellii]|uniref:DUF3267 domain-containing protein n=1 Tax=Paraclostridium sordellii TaxID=1505 RepID=UPI00038562FC|nr:DUF3267 domain-containing protein [Paeniclostridium sordellii]AUO31655.1 hypothetical protein [Paeniclostridium sordellii]AUO31749.1 hypothetical protein [Paeniclostridium sordellii]EPZ61127.1 hypothetical protein H476_0323 [[Clostridium] sordellii VPI 9048] [Paeniclostridium sordellii VPI 9048]CEK40096.1 hypothetical protein JGS6382_PCS1300551 (plasmid) [[Clostridium] sordellii] [Paeniclostridium sordellii]